MVRGSVVRRLLTLGSILALGATAACGGQREGERCSILSENDCAVPLVCTAAASLSTVADLCCPSDRTAATTQACRVQASPIGALADAGAEGGAADAGSTPDAESPSDGGADGS